MPTDRPPLVLLHGFGCDARFWAPQADALCAAGWRLTTPDLPYHGGPTAGVPQTLEGLAAWVAAHGLAEPAVLIGHSLGGMIALQVAHDVPERVRGLALIDSFPDLRLNSACLPEMYGADPALRASIERCREEVIGRMTQAVYDAIWPSVAAFDAVPWLPELTMPVFGIYGGRGRYGAGEAEPLARDLQLERLPAPPSVVVVPDAAHFVNLEQPEAVNTALLAWLEERFGG